MANNQIHFAPMQGGGGGMGPGGAIPPGHGFQNTAFKDEVLLVNANMIIDFHPGTTLAGSAGNKYIRNNWTSSDTFRSVIRKLYSSNHGSDGWVTLSPPGSIPDKNSPLLASSVPGPKYYIHLDNNKWNAASYEPDTEDLLRQDIDIDGVYEGDPNWRYYLQGLPPGEPVSQPLAPFAFNVPVFANPGPFKDHANTYLKPSNDPAIREASGMTVKVESKYNFYADTTPPYENILADVSEPMITNYYCLQSELRNTDSTVNSQDYYQQITLGTVLQRVNVDNDDDLDPWFVNVSVGTGMSESTTSEFYSLYSKGVSILKDNPADVKTGGDYGAAVDLAGIESTFETTYKNYVILCSDLEGLNKLVVSDPAPAGLTNLPFYNTITIGYDNDAVEDPSNAGNFFRKLSAQLGGPENFSPFMDMLQLYIIDKITNNDPLEGFGSYANLTTIKTDAGNASATSRTLDDNYETGHHFNWERFMYHTSHQSLSTRINGNVSSNDSDNYILLRNYNTEDGVVDVDISYIEEVQKLDTAGDVDYPIRNFDEVMAGVSCYSEPVLYKIDKYNSSNTLVQTFFISARESEWYQKEIIYIDSQVKYGEKYRYDIKQIRLVFGNDYSYENLNIFYTDTAPASGLGIANALGFYRSSDPDIVLDDVVSSGVQEYTTTSDDPDYAATQTGHFIFQPVSAIPNQHQYNTLFNVGTDWTGEVSSATAIIADYIFDYIDVRVYPNTSGHPGGGAEGISLRVIPDPILPQNAPPAPPLPPLAQNPGPKSNPAPTAGSGVAIGSGKGGTPPAAQSQYPGSGLPAAGSAAQMSAPIAQSQPSSTPTVNTQTQVGTQTTSTYSIPSTAPKVGSSATTAAATSTTLPVLPLGWGYSSK